VKTDRRAFLKVCGLAALGLGLKPAVDVFAREENGLLLPQAKTSTGKAALTAKKWAMVVDTTKCDGCNACQVACHAAHNVPHFEEEKIEVKWIWTEKGERIFFEQTAEAGAAKLRQLPLPVLCNQCDNPPCVKVCPTQATFKREDGIVMMDSHRCIGCRYCMVACPYGARSFNAVDPRHGLDMAKANPDFPTRTRGVVEKCNFCVDRLAKGNAPACVEACPKKALLFGDVEDPNSEVRKVLNSRFTIRRRPSLGTGPQIHYVVG